MFYFFLLFYNNLDLNNQKILGLPSIFQFERKLGFWTTLKSLVHLFNCSNSKKDKMKLCSQMQSLKLCNTFFPTKFRKVCLNYFCKNISNSTENKETLKIAEGKLSELFLLRCDSVVLISKQDSKDLNPRSLINTPFLVMLLKFQLFQLLIKL